MVGSLSWERHEHLYGDIYANIIKSGEFYTCGSRVKGIKVFLCTLSMLSNDAISKIFAKEFPISTLVVDEASQIHVADYISVFYKYVSLRKACFIGDDKQCEYEFVFSCSTENSLKISATLWSG